MGGGASKHHLQGGASPLKKNRSSIVEESQQFTNIETELKKPIDGRCILLHMNLTSCFIYTSSVIANIYL